MLLAWAATAASAAHSSTSREGQSNSPPAPLTRSVAAAAAASPPPLSAPALLSRSCEHRKGGARERWCGGGFWVCACVLLSVRVRAP